MKQLVYMLAAVILATSCGNNARQEEQIQAAKQATVDSINTVNAIRAHVEDSIKTEQAERRASASRNTSSSSASTTTTTTTTEEKKKGWSSTAKGAVIGAGAGALTGALVSKKKGTGAVVGGLIGAGAGAGAGAIIDHNKKKKQ